MRHACTLLTCLSLLGGCGTTAAERVVDAAGADHLDNIEQIDFTFNVQQTGKPALSRTWRWRPQDNQVMRTIGDQTVVYSRNTLGEDDRQVDAQFINDTFWLSPALHLHWAGPDVWITDEGEAEIPITGGPGRRILLAYPTEGGGYTPGDAYDLFVDEDDIIRAWHFRRGGAETPNLTTTFENYIDAGSLEIATEHRNADGTFRLWFTNITVKTNWTFPILP